jgi:hypothetical protein
MFRFSPPLPDQRSELLYAIGFLRKNICSFKTFLPKHHVLAEFKLVDTFTLTVTPDRNPFLSKLFSSSIVSSYQFE